MTIREIEDGRRVTEALHALVKAHAEELAPGTAVDRKPTGDMVQVVGWGFGIEIDGKQYVIGVEAV